MTVSCGWQHRAANHHQLTYKKINDFLFVGHDPCLANHHLGTGLVGFAQANWHGCAEGRSRLLIGSNYCLARAKPPGTRRSREKAIGYVAFLAHHFDNFQGNIGHQIEHENGNLDMPQILEVDQLQFFPVEVK